MARTPSDEHGLESGNSHTFNARRDPFGSSDVKSASATLLAADEGVSLKSLEDVREPSLDPRLSMASENRQKDDLDGGLSGRTTNFVRGVEDRNDSITEKVSNTTDTLYVEFLPGDRRNPVNFSKKKKWAITIIACFSTVIVSGSASAYNLGFESMIRDLQCTYFQATLGLSLYAFGFGIVPLVTASLSEEFGRFPLYLASSIGFILMYVVVGLAKNIQTVLIARFIQGSFGSTGATMVGGTIADIWSVKERGLPMCIFALSAVTGAGIGPVFSGWIEMNPRLEWRWIQWVELIICGLYTVLLPFIMKETRSSILLTRIARKLRNETGNHRYRARVEDEGTSLSTLIWISCTRPIHLMLTEPVVLSFSLWIGFVWGIFFCLIESVASVFKQLHGFNTGQVGTVFMTMVIGSFLGFISNFYQESLYQKHFSRKGPEARLYLACFAAVLFPVGMFIYAWCSTPRIHWIALAIGITLFMWALFIIYLSVFSYLADCYGPFASSALAGQSLARNLTATAFPLFTTQMYHNLGYNWANTIFASIGTVMIPIPFVLFFYGPAIRRRSRFSRTVMEAEERMTQ